MAKYLWERVCSALVLREKLILQTTSQSEAVQSQNRFPDVRTVIVRNGVELPGDLRKTDSKGLFRMTYLGRLHPIKGIEALLDACRLVNSESGPWHLNIAGCGEVNYTNVLKSKVVELGLEALVDFLGEVSGEKKEDLFANSDVVVVPSHVENFGMVVAEALAHEVPVIASRGTPWEGLQTRGCGLWVDNHSASLAAAIRKIRTMPLADMGLRGRHWMETEFSWQSVSSQMLGVFRDCIEAKPS